MKLITYRMTTAENLDWRAGIVTEEGILDIAKVTSRQAITLQEILLEWEYWREELARLSAALKEEQRVSFEQVQVGPTLPHPASFRDFYAFEAHVKTARARRGLGMVPEWYQFPVFYFSNPAAMHGPDDRIKRPKSSYALDYELEIACVIGKRGIDIPVTEADSYIAGFCILNDWSARDIQREEVKVGLGPAKGKDFATSIGPYLVTPDELADRRIPGEQGDRYDLQMVARVNGKEYSRGNFQDITFTFAQMIARASADCYLHPGDVIGSGTVGTGCILELGAEKYGWLETGDTVELEIDRLGVLRNVIG